MHANGAINRIIYSYDMLPIHCVTTAPYGNECMILCSVSEYECTLYSKYIFIANFASYI